MGWLSRLREKRNKTEAEAAALRAGGRWEGEGGALAPDDDPPIEGDQASPTTTH